MKISALVISLLVFFSNPSFGNEDITFQKNHFIQKNECNRETRNSIDALHLNIPLSKDLVKSSIRIAFSEMKSKFEQNILFDGKTFFYPKMFGPAGHHEYSLPICKSENPNCDFHFFIFNPSVLMLKTAKLNFKLVFYDQSNQSKVLKEIHDLKTKNHFDFAPESKLFEDTQLVNENNFSNIKAIVNKGKIRSLLKGKYTIEFIYSWRESLEQVQYSEYAQTIDIKHPWVKSESNEFLLPKTLKNPTYLSFMVHVRNKTNSYESKLEILNKKDRFYSCSLSK